MKLQALLASVLLVSVTLLNAANGSLRLHPENQRYFSWRSKPAVLITSGEHYGALINLDFDYATYLKTLESQKMNLTRVFTGAYVEPAGAFNIASNTLAPGPGKFIAPWARSSEPGYPNGGNKFDLNKWDAAYFKRLHGLMREAAKQNVVVELTLFCPFYEDSQWKLSPQNARNNVNGVGDVGRTNVYTLDRNGGLLGIHDALVRKLVHELNDYDNLYYEICNEPYFGGVTMDWQHHIVDVILKAERTLPKQHLISLNVANGSKKVVNPHPAVSIFNFHYASPPTAVAENYGMEKVIGLNETGFKGTNNNHYRMEAWEFMLAGGALYNNLDYSFAAKHERGDFVYPKTQPGGGNRRLRAQFAALRDFMQSLDFVHMRPDTKWIRSGVPAKTHVHGLAGEGKQYAAYFFSGTNAAPEHLTLKLNLPKGNYRAEWIDVLTGKTAASKTVSSDGTEPVELQSSAYAGEIALRLRR